MGLECYTKQKLFQHSQNLLYGCCELLVSFFHPPSCWVSRSHHHETHTPQGLSRGLACSRCLGSLAGFSLPSLKRMCTTDNSLLVMGSSQKPAPPFWSKWAISLLFEVRLDVCVSRVLQECCCPGLDMPANVVSCTHSFWLSGLNQRTKQDTVFSHTLGLDSACQFSISFY